MIVYKLGFKMNFCFLLPELRVSQSPNPISAMMDSMISHWLPKSPNGPSEIKVMSREKA
jgi:hypothetical protein